MKKIAIIVGAGASYDCVNLRLTKVNQLLRPPLVHELFDTRFEDIVLKYKQVSSSADEIRSFLLKNISIEEILLKFSKESDKSLKKTYYYLPLYLQSLFRKISEEYINAKSATKFETFLRTLQRTNYDKIEIVTLNYDTFIEKAFILVLNTTFQNPVVGNDYLDIDKRYNLYKLHGSSSWIRPVKRNGTARLEELIDSLDVTDNLDFYDGFYNNSTQRDLVDIIPKDSFQYPAISAPIKDFPKFNCPTNFINLLEGTIEGTTDFLFIGYSARDAHINHLLRNVSKVNKFMFVNGTESNGIEALRNLNLVVDKFNIDNTKIFNGGFASFVESGQLEKFLVE